MIVEARQTDQVITREREATIVGWETAQQMDTLVAYQNYLNHYPHRVHIREVTTRISQLTTLAAATA